MEKLYEWFCKQRTENVTVTSVRAKRKTLNKILKEAGGFSGNDGQLQKIKCKIGIRFLKIYGKKDENCLQIKFQ